MTNLYLLNTGFSQTNAFKYLVDKYEDYIYLDEQNNKYYTDSEEIFDTFDNANYNDCCLEEGLEPDVGRLCVKCQTQYVDELMSKINTEEE